MEKNNEVTTKIKVQIADLKNSMNEARKSVAYANSEFKAASSAMDDWSKSSDGISAKLKQLNSNLDAQEKVLSDYEKALEEVKKEYGETSDEAREYATKLNNQQAIVNKTKKEIASYEDALREVSEAEKIAAKTGKDVAEVLADTGEEAKDAGDGFTVLKGAVATFAGNVLTGLADGLRDAASNLLGLADATREYRNNMAKMESASSEAGYSAEYTAEKYNDLYGVLADDTATTTTVSNFMAMGASEETLNSLLNSSIGIWAKYGDSIPLDGLAESVNETSQVAKVTGNLADALNWAGINEDEFNAKLEKTTSVQERQELIAKTLEDAYSGLASTYQENNASVIEANKAQAEYNDVMGDLGAIAEPITTTLKKGLADVLREAISLFGGDVDVESFTSAIEGGFSMITETVLPAVKEGLGAVKDGFEWFKDNASSLAAGFAGIGTAMLMLNFTSLVSGLKSFVTTSKVATTVQAAFNAVMNANPIILVVTIVLSLIAALITFIATNEDARAKFLEVWEGIKTTFSNVMNAIVTFFTVTIPAAIQNIIQWFGQIPTRISEFVEMCKAKFVEWRDSMIETVVNFFSDLPGKIGYALGYALGKIIQWGADVLNFITTKIPEIINQVVKFFSQLPGKIWTWLVNVINRVTQWATNMRQKATEAGRQFINKVIEFISQLPGKVAQYLQETITRLSQWVVDMGNKGREAISELINKVVDGARSIPDRMRSIGSDIVSGVWNGILNARDQFFSNVKNFFSGLVDGAKDALGIESPSKVFAKEVGKWIPEGIAVGITANAKSALDAIKDLAIDAVGGASSSLGEVNASAGGVVNNFYQTINSPKQLSRLDIYRQSKNLLGYAGGGA